MEIITSRQNRYVSEAVALCDRKAREKTGRFRFDGVKLLGEAASKGVELAYLLVSQSRESAVFERLSTLYGVERAALDCRILVLADALFEKISLENAPDGVISVASRIDKFHKIATIYNDRSFTDGGEQAFVPQNTDTVLLLESVRDPLNMGALIRSAAALGVDFIICSADCADLYHPRTVRGAMGTLFTQPILCVDCLPDAVRALRAMGHRVFAAALDRDAQCLGSFDFCPGDCAVIGNEGHGLCRETLEACGRTVYIPMRPGVESLNAGVAGAILAWELQRGKRR